MDTLPKNQRSFLLIGGFVLLNLLVFCVVFVYHCLFFCHYSFCYCIVCPSSSYDFWLPLWHIQTLLLSAIWYSYEPNNAGPSKNEDCVHMKKRSGGKTEYKWNDVSCADSNHYICEK
jgi:ubiquitin-protein ligase